MISPRVTLPETIFAALLVCIGIAVLVGTLTSTPDDRRDLQFVALLVGGLLWGVLASLTIVARILQWKIQRRAEVVPSLT
jgi:Tfp pilus assembly protein PilN